MSSARGGGFRGRGRGSSVPPASSRGRGASSRGRATTTYAPRGTPSNRGLFPTASRSSTTRAPRGSQRGNGKTTSPQPTAFGVAKSKGSWQDRYQSLVKAREQERLDAIRQGLIADPDKPRSLSEAITPIGTCQEMCAEFERVQRVVQKDVWDEETDVNQSPYATVDKLPDEARMVKKFRRAAAGLEEQLPSDLRPPHVLRHTCDYLFEEVIGNAPSLAQVHHFVWDRTRAIRNDFSIQQVTKPEELRIAIDCYERIARFHILSLHQLALPEKPYSKYDWQQEREQLDRTLLSLMQYYDDSHGRIELPNEAEFRAYCVIFQLQDPTPDLEDRVQTWPRNIIEDSRVKTAVEVYMAACNVMDPQGPLKPRANHLIARQDWQRFWELVESKKVSYLTACVAEIYFNLVRRLVLNALFRTFRMKTSQPTVDWTLGTLCEMLAFDNGDEVYAYCEKFGFTFQESAEGPTYLDLTSVKGRTLPEPSAGIPKQSKSTWVEQKRYGRTLTAIINGITVKQAYERGMVKEDEDVEQMESSAQDQRRSSASLGGVDEMVEDGPDDGSSLFIPENKTTQDPFGLRSSPFHGAGNNAMLSTFTGDNPFQRNMQQTGVKANNTNPFSSGSVGSTFGKPSSTDGAASSSKATNTFSSPSTATGHPVPTFGAVNNAQKFDFAKDKGSSTTLSSSPFGPTFKSTSDVDSISTMKEAEDTAKAFTFGQPSGAQNNFAGPFQSPKTKQDAAMTAPSMFVEPPLSASDLPVSSTDIFATTPEPTQTKPLFSFTAPSQSSIAQTTPAKPIIENSPEQSIHAPTPPAAASPSAAQTETALFVIQADAPANAPNPVISQPQSFTSTPTSPTSASTHSPPTASSSLGPLHKRSSFSTDTKPKKPSPLSNSITATEDGTSAAGGDSVVDKQPPITQAKSEEQHPKSHQQTAAQHFEVYLTQLTNEVLHNPIDGLLKEYIEFAVHKTFFAVQDAIITEQDNQDADEFRQFRLCEKYGLLWREIFWRRRLTRTGRARRERRLRRLQQSQDLDSSSLNGSLFQLGSSGAASSFDINRRNLDKRSIMGQSISTAAKKIVSGAWPEEHNDNDNVLDSTVHSVSDSHGDGNKIREPSTARKHTSTIHTSDRATSPYPSRYTEPSPQPRASRYMRAQQYMRSLRQNGARSLYNDMPGSAGERELYNEEPKHLAFGVHQDGDAGAASARSSLSGSHSGTGYSTSGLSTRSNFPLKDTTVSSYFRQKAAGLHTADRMAVPRELTRGTNSIYSSERSRSAFRSPSQATAAYSFPPRVIKHRTPNLQQINKSPQFQPEAFEATSVKHISEPRGTKRRSEESQEMQTSPPSLRETFKSIGIQQDHERRGTKRGCSEPHSRETSPPALRSTHGPPLNSRDAVLDAQIARSKLATEQYMQGAEVTRAARLQSQEPLHHRTISPAALMAVETIREPSPILTNHLIDNPPRSPVDTQTHTGIISNLGSERQPQYEGLAPYLSANGVENSNALPEQQLDGLASPTDVLEDDEDEVLYDNSSSAGSEQNDPTQRPFMDFDILGQSTSLAPIADDTEEVYQSAHTSSDDPVPFVEHTDDEELVENDRDEIDSTNSAGVFDEVEREGGDHRAWVEFTNASGEFYFDPSVKHPAELRAERRRAAREAYYEALPDLPLVKHQSSDESEEEEDDDAEDKQFQHADNAEEYDDDADGEEEIDEDAEEEGEGFEDEEDDDFDRSTARYPAYPPVHRQEADYDDSDDEEQEQYADDNESENGEIDQTEDEEDYDEQEDGDLKSFTGGHRHGAHNQASWENLQTNGHAPFHGLPNAYGAANSWAAENNEANGQGNTTLQAIGNTVEEAIELSD